MHVPVRFVYVNFVSVLCCVVCVWPSYLAQAGHLHEEGGPAEALPVHARERVGPVGAHHRRRKPHAAVLVVLVVRDAVFYRALDVRLAARHVRHLAASEEVVHELEELEGEGRQFLWLVPMNLNNCLILSALSKNNLNVN